MHMEMDTTDSLAHSRSGISGMPTHQKTILLVEDEAEIADILGRALVDAGFHTLVARDGEEGLRLALTEKPDFILLDVVLPKIDGITVLKKIRTDPRGTQIPVVLLSNYGFQETADHSFALGASDYWLKVDLEPRAVVAQIKEYLKIGGPWSK